MQVPTIALSIPAPLFQCKPWLCLLLLNTHRQLIPAWPEQQGKKKLKSVSLHASTSRAIAPAPARYCQ